MTRLSGVMSIWTKLPFVLLLAGLLVGAAGVAKAGGPINTGYFGNIAILGYDPVAYFADSRAVEGSPAFSTSGWAPLGSSPAPNTGRFHRRPDPLHLSMVGYAPAPRHSTRSPVISIRRRGAS